jgi:16S rRNA (cytosine967-C5)-methyltransferase
VDLLRCALPEPNPALAGFARRPRIQTAALNALTEAREGYPYPAPTLARWFRKARYLGARDRRTVTEVVYSVIRHEHLLTRVTLARGEDPVLETLVKTWPELAEGARFEELLSSSPAEDYATALSLPYDIAREWLDRLGPGDAAKLARVLARRAPTTIRANQAQCTREQLRERLVAEGLETTPCALTSLGLTLERPAQLHTLESFREGWFEVQDAASQLLCEALPLDVGTTVLDLCAGAGGKSLALAARGAQVLAHDIRSHALDQLDKRASRAGAQVEVGPPRPCQVVLVDAPCSGTGRIRREPSLRWNLQPHEHLQTQIQLLEQARQWVEPGGLLAYATCSLLEAENEHRVEGWIQDEHRTLWPHEHGCDGMVWTFWRQE